MEHEAQKLLKPKILRTIDYECAYVTVMAVLIIFLLTLQIDINLRMLSVRGDRPVLDVPNLEKQKAKWSWLSPTILLDGMN